ncbi:hypothetical protein AVEN_129071-1 [Araneus ventricosus]|uniref:Uncharacterized protein n=1 Tax=Araneus ventricosus TaxID=182803 RepID=A0A4Y2NFU2_ARAVE|nr:hypothetical protein AVEN_129071-1 [Araneus ventricosus]
MTRRRERIRMKTTRRERKLRGRKQAGQFIKFAEQFSSVSARRAKKRHGEFINVMKTSPGETRYSTTRITDVKSAFETVFSSNIQNGIIKMKNRVKTK